MKRKVLIMMMLCVIMMSICPVVVIAHSGRTDGAGGHYNRSTDEYHWHHGYGAHQHEDMDGDGDLDCPYDFRDTTGSSSGSSSSGGSTYSRPPASPTPYRTPLPRNTPTPEPEETPQTGGTPKPQEQKRPAGEIARLTLKSVGRSVWIILVSGFLSFMGFSFIFIVLHVLFRIGERVTANKQLVIPWVIVWAIVAIAGMILLIPRIWE